MPLPSLPSSEEILAALVGGGIIGWLGRAFVAREKRLGADHDAEAKADREREKLLAEERSARIQQAGEIQRALVALAESIASGMTKNHETHDAIISRFEHLFTELRRSPSIASSIGDDRIERLERQVRELSDRLRRGCSKCDEAKEDE